MLIPESVNYGWFYVSESKRQNSKPYPLYCQDYVSLPTFLARKVTNNSLNTIIFLLLF